jgi:hypothetical protein
MPAGSSRVRCLRAVLSFVPFTALTLLLGCGGETTSEPKKADNPPEAIQATKNMADFVKSKAATKK